MSDIVQPENEAIEAEVIEVEPIDVEVIEVEPIKNQSIETPPEENKPKSLWSKFLQFIGRFLPSYTFEISAKDLEKRLLTTFPIKKKASIFVFKISDPEVVFPPDKSSHIGISMTLKVSILGLFAAKGRGLVLGEIDYSPEQGAFYFFDPEIQELEIKGLRRSHQTEVKELFEGIVQAALSEMCVYQFNTKDRKQAIAKRLLKSVRVEDGRLKIQLGF